MNELNIIEQAIEIAQQKGCFSLKDAVIIANALETIKTKIVEVKVEEA